MKQNIIFISIDSLRSDKFHGISKTSQTPTLDNLLKNGTYFEQAISSADATILSWSSIFTGKFPFKTGIVYKKSLAKKIKEKLENLNHQKRLEKLENLNHPKKVIVIHQENQDHGGYGR